MKICIVNEFFRPFVTGGVDIFLDDLSKFLTSKGFEVKIITSRAKGTKKYEKEKNLEIYRVKSSPISLKHFQQIPGVTFPCNFFNYSLRSELKKIINDTDIVHINNLYHLSFAPLQAAKALNKKIILDIHDYWPICFRKDLLHPSNKLCSYKDPFSCYACLSLTDLKIMPFGVQLFSEFFARNNLLKSSDDVIAHSEFVSKKTKEYIDLNSEVIPYPYVGKIMKRKRQIQEKVTMVFLARLQIQKGAHLLLDVARKLEKNSIDYEILVLGDGPLFSKLKNVSKRENLKIKLFGFIFDREKKYEIFKRSDILLAPSMWYEPFGIVVLEAMAFGIPIVGSNLGGIGELINKNNVGFAVKPDAERIVESIKSLVHSPALYKQFSNNGHKNIKKYDQKQIFSKYLRLFEKAYV